MEGLRSPRAGGAAHSMTRSLGLKGDRESRPSRLTTWKRGLVRQAQQEAGSQAGSPLPCPPLYGEPGTASLTPPSGALPADHWLLGQAEPHPGKPSQEQAPWSTTPQSHPPVPPHREAEAQRGAALTAPLQTTGSSHVFHEDAVHEPVAETEWPIWMRFQFLGCRDSVPTIRSYLIP